MGYISEEIESMFEEYDDCISNKIYLLTNCDVPFIQDGYRDGELIRDWMYERFYNKLQENNKIFYILTGDYDERLQQACDIINNEILLSSLKH